MRFIRTTTALAAAAFVVACESVIPEVRPMPDAVIDDLGVIRPGRYRIYYGFPPDQPMHAAAVSLHELTPDGTQVYVVPFCSGTLIHTETEASDPPYGSGVVLTAAHCLDVASGGKNFVTMPPSLLAIYAIYVGDDPFVDIVEHLYLVTETHIHTAYDRRELLNDLGLVRLAWEVTESPPVPYLPARLGITALDVGVVDNINFAGFGDTEDPQVYGIKMQVDGTLASVGCGVAGCPDEGDGPTMFSYVQAPSGPCFGDSGGPAFIQRCKPFVAGVTSYGDQNCYINAFIGTAPPEIPPIADGGGPQTANIGQMVTFDGNSSDDPDGTLLSYECNFRDVSTASGTIVNHAFTTPNVYPVRLTVTDDDCLTHTTLVETTILPPPNNPPVSDPGSGYSGD
ncbi:MAG: trypsin-like serine protease, partial [Deltaproteobacteria bacterium]|nr:trypsin-like serine protease [Deltaproteobacteria bacterium]